MDNYLFLLLFNTNQTSSIEPRSGPPAGAHNWSRTSDLFLTKEVLYRLSYVGNFSSSRLERVMGIEPTSSAWKAEVLPLNYTRRFSIPDTNTL